MAENINSLLRRAGSTALRDMRSEARKRIRARKNLRANAITRALLIQRPRTIVAGQMGEWRLNVAGGTTYVSDYPGARQIGGKRGWQENSGGRFFARGAGISVQINRGKRSILKSAFFASVRGAPTGIYERKGRARFPIRKPLASRPVDALLHPGEAQGVAERGRRSFVSTFDRLRMDARTVMPALHGRIQ